MVIICQFLSWFSSFHVIHLSKKPAVAEVFVVVVVGAVVVAAAAVVVVVVVVAGPAIIKMSW